MLEFTPSSTSGISLSSDSLADLAQTEAEEEEKEADPTNVIPDHIVHDPPANSTDKVWELIHRLEELVMHRGKSFTHFCMLCLETKSLKESLCRAMHTSNAKSHLLSGHKEHALAAEEQQHRLKRTERYTEKLTVKREKRPPDTASPADDEKPTKRQKTWWKAPASPDQVTGHVARCSMDHS
jgi:hypothetical protein